MRVSFERMYQEFLRVLLKMGFRQHRAELCARLFAETSRDGVYSHGLNRFPRFIEYIKKGYIDVHAEPERIFAFGAFERWDGKLGPGNLNAYFCMDRAIHLARQNGTGAVAIKNTNHWMRAGTYGWQAAEAGCIGMCWTNTQPNMPAWGGKDRKLGNNPFVISVPREKGHVVLDMATSLYSYGKLEYYRRQGQQLPFEGGFDKQGKLTKDPAAIEESWRTLPIGYWKGAGLALMLDLTATLLSTGKSTFQLGKHEDEYGLSQVFIAFDVNTLVGKKLAGELVEEIIADLHRSIPASEDDRIYYPGERTLASRRENMEKGIPVDPDYWQQVLEM